MPDLIRHPETDWMALKLQTPASAGMTDVGLIMRQLIIATILLVTDVLLIYPAFIRMIIKNSEDEILKIANLITQTHFPHDKIALSRAPLSTRLTGDLANISSSIICNLILNALNLS